MRTAAQWLELVRFAAAGGILATAITNIAINPSDKVNMIAAAVGAVLTVILVKARHMV